MSKFEFISHQEFPQDEYYKEIVYLCLDGKYRIAYVRKKSQHGGLFWSPVCIGITNQGKREYFPAFIQDSNFLEKDIKEFLEKRVWESKSFSTSKPQFTQNLFSQNETPF